MKPVGLFDRWSIDLMTHLPRSEDGYTNLLVCIESFSRHCELVPLRTQNAKELAEAVFNTIFCRFGAPLQIMSDCGRNLTSGVMKCLNDCFKVKHFKSAPYNPQSNGLVEQFNRTILKSFRLYCSNQKEWPNYLAPLQYAYRATSNVGDTKFSPFYTMYAKEMRLVCEPTFGGEQGMKTDVEAYLKELIPKVELINKVVQENTKDSQSKTQERYNRDAKDPGYQVGDKVLVEDKTRKIGENPKMRRKYSGPYLIISKCGSNTFKVRHCETEVALKGLIHADRLKRFVENKDEFYSKVREAQEMNKRQESGTHDGTTKVSPGGQEIQKRKRGRPRKEPPIEVQPDKQTADTWIPIKGIVQRRGVGRNAEFE